MPGILRLPELVAGDRFSVDCVYVISSSSSVSSACRPPLR